MTAAMAQAATPHQDPRLVVWFDGDCPLCRREVQWIRGMDRLEAIQFIDLSLGQPCPIDRQTMLRRFHAQEGGQALVSGAAAFGAMWRRIPALRPLGLLAQWRPALWGLERAYLIFLRFRPLLQAAARRLERGPDRSARGRHGG